MPPPKLWPSNVVYRPDPVWLGTDLTLTPFPSRGLSVQPLPAHPAAGVRIKRIDDPAHPAFGQCGLVAAKDLRPGTLLMVYSGGITLRGEESDTSDYVLGFGPSLAIDAELAGNEGRFTNDYRGVGDKPNVAFKEFALRPIGPKERTIPAGDVRMGIWVGGEKIRRGEELLISYGKGFWKARGLLSSDS